MNESTRSTNHPANAHRKTQYQLLAGKGLPQLAHASSIQSRQRISLQACEGADDEPPCEERRAKRERAATRWRRCHLFALQVERTAEFALKGRAWLKPAYAGTSDRGFVDKRLSL